MSFDLLALYLLLIIIERGPRAYWFFAIYFYQYISRCLELFIQPIAFFAVAR